MIDRHHQKKEDVEELIDSLKSLFDLAMEMKQKAKNIPQIKFILSEPTNLDDWLFGKIGKFGELVYENIGDWLIDPTNSESLKMLGMEEAGNLLTETIDGKQNFFPQGNLMRNINYQMGGNPWLLAWAVNIAGKVNYVNIKADSLIKSVMEVIRKSTRGKESLNTIIGSLSIDEQFLVRMLYSKEEQDNEMIQDIFTHNKPEEIWKNDACDIAERLANMGLIVTEGNAIDFPLKISSPIIKDSVKTELLNNRPTTFNLSSDKDIWERFIWISYPNNEVEQGITIIHQFGDLFFGPDGHAAWTTYIQFLANTEEEKRPHFLVICGSLIRGITKNVEYADALEDAFSQLAAAVRYLQPAEVKPANDPEGKCTKKHRQVVIVPGIFDFDWKPAKKKPTRELYRQIWNELIRRNCFSSAGARHSCRSRNVEFFAFDTVGLEGMDKEIEGIGEKQIAELASNREILKAQFEACIGKDGLLPEKRDDFTKIITYYIPCKVPLCDAVRNDTGFISPDEKEILNEVNNEPEGTFKIAITHHYPQQRSPLTGVEFFKGFSFRQDLVAKGVQFVLHGHSTHQQSLTERIEQPAGVKKSTPHQINLLSSGIFSDGLIRSATNVVGTFNEIIITPPHQHRPPKNYDVSINFYAAHRQDDGSCSIKKDESPVNLKG